VKAPLEGIRVADFSWYGAGPIGTQTLAWYGAEVIRVESEARVDGLRMTQPAPVGKSGYNVSGYYNNFNSNKLSFTLNMSKPEARDIALRFISKCDVVVENYQAGVFEKWGLSYEAMTAVKPDVIFVRQPVAGTTGPHRDFSAFGAVMTPITGLSHLSGYPDRPPIGIGTNYPDYVINPGHQTIAILAALRHRRRTGRGQYVEVAQLESTMAVVGPALIDYTANGRIQERAGNRQENAAPHGVFPCLARPVTPPVEGAPVPLGMQPPPAEEDRWIAIAVLSDEQWQAMKKVMGEPAWASDARFDTLAGRKANEDALERLVGEWTASQKAEELMNRLQAAGVPAGVVHTSEDVLDHDVHLKARGYYVYLDHAETGKAAYDGSPFKMSRTPGGPLRPAPLLGEHTMYVAKDIIGLGEDEISDLVANQVLF
jgi:crotonobetainyl-CoA:carnitine CoA-transferase CaiB-like acyl-CoA transferase